MGRLREAVPAPRTGGTKCRICRFIDNLEGEDRDDAEYLWRTATFGHAQVAQAISSTLGIHFLAERIGDCRRKGHRGQVT